MPFVKFAKGLSRQLESLRANNAINDMVRQKIFNRFASDIVEGNAIYRLTLWDWHQRLLYSSERVLNIKTFHATFYCCRRVATCR